MHPTNAMQGLHRTSKVYRHAGWRALLCASAVSLMASGLVCAQNAAPPPATGSSFFSRLGAAYDADWHPDPQAPATDAPARRGLPSPLNSPPFPAADWSYGGSPVIGEPDTNTYPLMTAINRAKSRTKIYGWFEPSVNGSTSRDSNSPTLNDVYPNRFELSQFVVYMERLPDTVQRDHVDWGFHLTSLVGTDYRFTTGKGYVSGQYIDHQNLYGFDPSLEYVDLYLPHIAKGMNLRLGRYISIPGIEAQLAPNNYTFSHSLLYAIDLFTDTGLLATVKLSDQWLVQVESPPGTMLHHGQTMQSRPERSAWITRRRASTTMSISARTALIAASTRMTICSNMTRPGTTSSRSHSI